MKLILTAVLSCVFGNLILAQQYTINGNATQTDCHSYVLTFPSPTQSGSVWNNNKIDLSQSFTFTFDVYLGDPETFSNDGADGIAFVLQPISTSIGGNGSGLGFGGINPSIGITMDTYQNSSPDNDPFYDHIAIQKNGDLNHVSANNLAGPVTIINGNNNAEDGLWHTLKIAWNVTSKTLDVYIDGSLRVSRTEDFVTTTFSNDPLVYWGFTGSTGALVNLQRFKTTLTPQWNFSATQKRCVNEPITFNDATIAFAPLAKVYWNFGDGSNIDSVNLNPTHTYTIAGDYTVIQKVRGADGCEETNTQTVRIGSKPVAGFYNADSCVLVPTHFFDTSHVTVGTINSIYWNLDNAGLSSTLNNPVTTYNTAGIKTIKLIVKTLEGCESDTLVKLVKIRARPVVDFNFTDSVCLGTAMTFTDASTLADGPVNGWVWIVDATNMNNNAPTLTHSFLTAGNHTVSLIATGTGNADCFGNLITKNVFIRDKPIAHFTYNRICQTVQTIYTDSSYASDGASMNQWWWDLDNGNIAFSQNPSPVYNTAGADTVLLAVTTVNGCRSDTIKQPVFVNAKPIANFGINALVCIGTPVQFSDSSLVANSSINTWSWLYNGSVWSNAQNPSGIFVPGPQTISLTVASNIGCKSDTITKPFVVYPKPSVSMTFKDECKFTPVSFTGLVVTGNIDHWHWSFGDAGIANTMNASHTYTANGTYPVELYGVNDIGCSTDVLKKDIIIYGTNAFAGHDTIAAAGQPVQLNAVGGLSYVWSPAAGLSNNSISNPIAILEATQTYTVKAFTPEGCESFDDIKIEIYKGPDIYLPTAFTPNDDGLNDIFRGKPVGIKEFRYLKVYNRWGQEVFATTDYHIGWDGSWKGAKQGNGIFVVIASGVDFRGKLLNKKTTVMLIR
ncbi:hypothetical protein BH11BAC4_BH11BAC4_15420 [soil metagenome]